MIQSLRCLTGRLAVASNSASSARMEVGADGRYGSLRRPESGSHPGHIVVAIPPLALTIAVLSIGGSRHCSAVGGKPAEMTPMDRRRPWEVYRRCFRFARYSACSNLKTSHRQVPAKRPINPKITHFGSKETSKAKSTKAASGIRKRTVSFRDAGESARRKASIPTEASSSKILCGVSESGAKAAKISSPREQVCSHRLQLLKRLLPIQTLKPSPQPS